MKPAGRLEGFGGWRRIAGLLLAIAALVFLGVFIGRNIAELRAHEWTVRPALLLASIVLNVVSLSWGVAVWQRVLGRMDVAVSYVRLARVWFVSGLARYVPGKIWQFVGAAQLGSSAGISGVVTATSLAVHTGFFLLGAAIVAIYLVPVELPGIGGSAVILLRWLAPALLLFVHPAVVGAGVRLVRKTTGGRVAQWTGRTWEGVVLVLASAGGWIISGTALFLFVRSLTPLPSSALPGTIGINAFAFAVGYVVFIAPAGLGAKEATLAALLSIYVPPPVAAVVAIAARLWMVVAEIVPALVLLRLPLGVRVRDRTDGPSSP